jgi:hypothetical protein
MNINRCDEVPCPAHATARPALTVRRPLRPLWRPVLAEIYLCNVCSCQERLRRHGRGQPALGRLERRPRWLGQQCHCDAGYSGALGWDASSARWVGRCAADPCRPAEIAWSTRQVLSRCACTCLGTATQYSCVTRQSARAAGACRAVTDQRCRYRCEPGCGVRCVLFGGRFG